MQGLNVIFDPLHKLGLVLSDGSTDMWPHKQGVEAREDSEHLIGVLGCSKLVSQSSCDPRLNSVNSLVVPSHTNNQMKWAVSWKNQTCL